MAKDNGGSAWFVAGFIVGGLVGFAAGLLMAPQPGEQTQAQLRERGIELKGMAEDLALEARKKAEELQEKSQVVLEERKVRIEGAIAEGKEVAAKKKEELMAKLEEERGKATAEAQG
jgi:gas vesicle protein